jgi:hydroxymethylbilane synthase
VAAVLARASVDDVLISKRPDPGPKAVIATGSVRRQYQLRWKQPGIEIVDLRGNVPTRLRKLVNGNWDGIVLARAGIERLGFDLAGGSFDFEGVLLHAKILPADDFLPAGGQGVVAIQARSGDEKTRAFVRAINHNETLLCLEAEREFLRLLQGDCGSPVGVLAAISDSAMTIRAQVFEPPRIEPRIARVEDEARSGKMLAGKLWKAIDG